MATINDIQITFARTIEEARAALANGFCPIECSFGTETVVDDLMMDHHGELSELACVSIRAYRDHFGARASDPRFVVTGNPGADDIFALLALAGMLPHPSRQVPAYQAKQLTEDLSPLAEFIAKLDRDPVGVDKSAHPWGAHLIVWGAVTQGPNGLIRHIASIYAMWELLEQRPPMALLNAARQEDVDRREKAKTAEFEMYGKVKFLPASPVWAPDVYHERLGEETNPDLAAGWGAPITVMFVPLGKNITVGAANKAVAEDLFGPGGLKNVFLLLGDGWGGAENVGGSPRGMEMTEEDARHVAQKMSMLIKSSKK